MVTCSAAWRPLGEPPPLGVEGFSSGASASGFWLLFVVGVVEVVVGEEVVETDAVFDVGVVGAVVGEEIVEIVAAAVLLVLLVPEAVRVHGPWARVLGLTDANAVKRRVVDAVLDAGAEKVGEQDRGTKDSACETSARGRNPEIFVFRVCK